MFKSIQWKLVLLYLLLIIFIIMVIGVFLLKQVEVLYYDNFEKGIKLSFDATDFRKEPTDITDLEGLKSKVNFYSGMFLIDGRVRNIYILDNFGIVKYGSYFNSSIAEQEIDKKQFATPNVIKAIGGQVGNEIKSTGNYLDYSQPLTTKDGNKYIIYITDNKTDLISTLDKIKKSIIVSFLLSLILSTIVGFLLARTITIPIKNLAQKAKKIAEGDFEEKIEETSQDEIGQLTKDFNYMAKELKNTLNDISSEKSKVETILNYMADGVMAFDKQGNIIHINPAAQKMINMEVKKKKFDDIFLSIGADITIGEFIYLKDDSVKERKVKIEESYFKIYFVAFRAESGKIGGIIVVFQDITEQQRLDNMRREFVANVSHELRTPLTTIKSYVETLLDGAMDDKSTTSDFLKVIENESDRMTRIVKDLLELSKIDYQQIEWKKEEVCLDKLINHVLKKINIEVKNKNQKIEYYMTTNVPDVLVDKDKIEQVLLNIISNAIKYTQEGGQISIYLGSIYNDVYIKIIDNGIGIPKKDLPRIFERFYRVDKARTRDAGGTGLGLAIAKEILEAQGGSINISSQVGKGTEVIINLPINKI